MKLQMDDHFTALGNARKLSRMKTNPEYEAFDNAMGRILRAVPKAVKDAMESEKAGTSGEART
jgi:hypothetical protein